MVIEDHRVVVTPSTSAALPDVFSLRCTCGWSATATGVEAARGAAEAHADKTDGERR